MKNTRLICLLTLCALTAACNSGTATQGKSTMPPTATSSSPPHASSTLAASSAQAVVHPSNGTPKTAPVQGPSPGQVLSDIYQTDSHGADSMDIGNGSQATYWYGYAFELGGKHYFTGFAYDTPEKFGNQDDTPSPDSKVTLTEVTYEGPATGPAKDAWTYRFSERHIGEFGSYERADTIDGSQQAQSYPVKNNQLILALPTWYLASGVRMHNHAIFIFNPKKPDDPENTRWTYLGDVSSGEDNSAACDADGTGNHMPCVKSSGTLSYTASNGSDLPAIHIAMSGTAIDDAGKARPLGPADAREYRYDPAKKTYEESTRTGTP